MASVKAVNTISTFSKRQFERSQIMTGPNTIGAENVQAIS
jgi:hypothetical protein